MRERRGDFFGRAVPLHLHGIELHVRAGEPPLQHAQDVADGRAGGRSDDADAPRHDGQRLLARFVEEPFLLQLFLQLLEGQLQRAQPHGLDVTDVHLIFAAHFVDAEGSAHADVQAILGTELDAAQLIAKADATNLRARILQSEIEVTGLRGLVIGDFAFDPNVGESAFEQTADLAR